MLTLEERNELISSHISFAEQLASVQFRKIPSCVQWDELKSAAYMGLVDAAEKYDGSKPFKSYASFRIFGEIKDYLRTLYWGGRRGGFKVSSWDSEYEQVSESESEDFNDFFEGITKMLSPLSKKILYMYYAEDKTMKQIGVEVNLSASRVYQILQDNLQVLRETVDAA